MSKKDKKTEWSDKFHRELLIEQRKHLYLPDTIEKLAKWFGLRPGMTVVDVGCGLGFLGYTYWKYFGKRGCYIGVDVSHKLIKEARKEAKKWAKGGKAYFYTGNAYNLPFSDNFADCVMCQILLIHLKSPSKAISEMIRVVKGGGLVICKEPDHFSELFPLGYSFIPELSIEEKLLTTKIALYRHKGKKKLGKGDFSFGKKVPVLMHELGLVDVDVRINDKVNLLIPPYKDEIQQTYVKRIKRWAKDKEMLKTLKKEIKRYFLDGGGNPEDLKRFIEMGEYYMKVYREQLKKGEYKQCEASIIYITKGRKPTYQKKS